MAKGVYLHKPENYPPSRKGVRLTVEHKQKVSNGMKGKRNSLGYKHSEENIRLRKLNATRPALGKFGKDHPHWKEVKTSPLRHTIRCCFQYRQWRSDVYTRDSYSCVLCGKKGGELNADHFPKLFSEILREYNIKTYDEAISCEELWNINNGRTLCVPCHRNTPSFKRRHGTTNI